MSIDDYLKKIKTAIEENNIMKVIEEIRIARKNYPFHKKIKELIEKNNKIFGRLNSTDDKKILSLYNSLHPSSAILELKKLFEQNPNNVLINLILGNVYGLQNQFNEAKIYQEKAISLNPFDETLYMNLSTTLEKQGNYKDSLRILLYAEVINPDRHEVQLSLARTYFKIKNYTRAQFFYEKIIKKKNDTKIKFEYCRKLLTLNNIKTLFRVLNSIKHNENNFLEKLLIKGLAYFTEKKIDLAIETFLEVLKLEKNENGITYSYLALCYEENRNLGKAKEYHDKAIKINPKNHLVLKNYANFFYFIGDVENAQNYYKQAIKINKFDFDTKYFLSLLQLFKTDFNEGWKNFEHRWLAETFSTKEEIINLPLFRNNIDQKKIYIWGEQGIGDQIIFSRFFKNLHSSGKEMYVKINPKLIKLFERSFPYLNFVENFEKDKVQCHMPIGNLGKFFINNIEDVKHNSTAYLKVNKEKSNKYKQILPSGKLICGISWESKSPGTGKSKSLSLKKLKKILNMPEYIFVDLQYGDTSEERQEFFKNYGIKIFKVEEIDNLNDLESLTSLIECCDMVLTVSNTTAHYAGGIGKKTFLMLPRGKGNLWYWSKNKDCSIWYESIKIFQQSAANEWSNLIDRVYNQMIIK